MAVSTNDVYYNTAGGTGVFYQTGTYGTFPDVITLDSVIDSDGAACIYCNYTPATTPTTPTETYMSGYLTRYQKRQIVGYFRNSGDLRTIEVNASGHLFTDIEVEVSSGIFINLLGTQVSGAVIISGNVAVLSGRVALSSGLVAILSGRVGAQVSGAVVVSGNVGVSGSVTVISGIVSVASGGYVTANTNIITKMSSTVHTVTAESGGLCIASTNNIRTMIQLQNQKSGGDDIHISETALQSGEGYIIPQRNTWKTKVYTGPVWAIANTSGDPVCTQEISIT